MTLREVVLGAADIDALEAFYGATLGLPVHRERNRLVLTAGPSRLVFVRHADAGNHHFAFNVPVVDFEDTRAWIAARAPQIADADGRTVFDFRGWDAVATYFRDPAGNVGELIARRNLHVPSAAPSGSGPRLSLSEIGLATPDVPALVRRLRNRTGLEIFRGSESEGFAALGDDQGLLIVVREGRDWYPTTSGAVARLQAVRVTLETDAGRTVCVSGTSCRIRVWKEFQASSPPTRTPDCRSIASSMSPG